MAQPLDLPSQTSPPPIVREVQTPVSTPANGGDALSPAQKEGYARNREAALPADQGKMNAAATVRDQFPNPTIGDVTGQRSGGAAAAAAVYEGIGQRFDKAVASNNFAAVTGELKGAALEAYKQGGMQAVQDLQHQLNGHIKTDHTGVYFKQNGDKLEVHNLQQLPKEEQKKYTGMTGETLEKALAKDNLIKVPGFGICRELSPAASVDLPHATPEQLKKGTDAIVASIKAGDKDAATALKFQEALNSGIPIDDLVKSVNNALPPNLRPPSGDAISTHYFKGRTDITVHPGIGGFGLEASYKDGKWSVKPNGERLRDLP